MTNQPAFELNQAIQTWRTNLAQSPALRGENLAELESHLRDSIAALDGKGLSEEEAFLIAVRRCGNREKLQVEFLKPTRFEFWIFRLIWTFILLFLVVTAAAVALNPFMVIVPLGLTFFLALAALNAFLLRRANPRSRRQVMRSIFYWLMLVLFAASLIPAGYSMMPTFCAAWWFSEMNAGFINNLAMSAVLPGLGFGGAQIVMLVLLLANLVFTWVGKNARAERWLKLQTT